MRYFNKATGYGGEGYPKKTDKAMCDELGDDEYMQGYVMEQGGTSLCSVEDPYQGCGDKEKDFIKKWAEKSGDDVGKQLARLEGMSGGSMKADLKKWLGQRKAILKQFAKKSGKKDEL